MSRLAAPLPGSAARPLPSSEPAPGGFPAVETLAEVIRTLVEALGSGVLDDAANPGLAARLASGELHAHQLAVRLTALVMGSLALEIADARATDAPGPRRRRAGSEGRLAPPASGSRERSLGGLLASLARAGVPALYPDVGSDPLPDLRLEAGLADGIPDALRRAPCGTPLDLGSIHAAELGGAYETLLQLSASVDRGRFELRPGGDERKRRGSFFTPARLIELLLDAALEPALHEATRASDPTGAILALRVCDPACGSGLFLAAAARRIGRRLAEVSSAGAVSQTDLRRAILRVIRRCLYGIDSDPLAVVLCRLTLWLEAGAPRRGLGLEARVRVGDGLLGGRATFAGAGSTSEADGPARSRRLAAPPARGFDVVLGNPPFVNAIEGGVERAVKESLARRYPRLRGTADLAYYFLEAGLGMLAPGGRLGMVQPRAVLNAGPAASLRLDPGPGLGPNLIYLPHRPDLFRGASTFVCLLALGPAERCRIGLESPDGRTRWRSAKVGGENWWHAVQASGPPPRPPAHRLGDLFEVGASMTAAEAYDARPLVRDSRNGPGIKLITTGLIDPRTCLWGQRACRYLGRRYSYPRIDDARDARPSLRRRLHRAARPKLVVAGLSSRIECFLDPNGETLGAVSTYTILHPTDDREQLTWLMELLLAVPASDLFRLELGANAMGGGNITMKKSFLAAFPLPVQIG